MIYSGTGGFSGLTGIPAEEAGGTVSIGEVSLGGVSTGGVSLGTGVMAQEKKTAASTRQSPAGKYNFIIINIRHNDFPPLEGNFYDFFRFFKAYSIPAQYKGMDYIYENPDSDIGIHEGRNDSYSNPLSLPKERRPRERLIRSSPEALSDQDLLAIILVSGVKGKNVTLLARELLLKLDREKKIPTVKELCRLSGLGISKACTIAAMLEFGRRKWASGQRIRCPMDIFNLIRHYADRRQERFICLSLNGAHEVLASRLITIGLVNRTIIHPREVFADPILDRASAVVVAHNHPSGNIYPSEEDNEITYRLKAAADILGINFLDHLIFSENLYFSFRQDGLINDIKEKQQYELCPQIES